MTTPIVLTVVAFRKSDGRWVKTKESPLLIARPFAARAADGDPVERQPFLEGMTFIRFADDDDTPCAVRESVREIANLMDARSFT